MALNLIKLCVGVESVDHLRDEINESRPAGTRAHSVRITTRMAPKRADELLAGGSLYWVIKGSVAARQRIVGMEAIRDAAGVSRTAIDLDAEVVAVRPRPCRPFQGWRYLRVEDSPVDLPRAAFDDAMPPAMRRDLLELCLI